MHQILLCQSAIQQFYHLYIDKMIATKIQKKVFNLNHNVNKKYNTTDFGPWVPFSSQTITPKFTDQQVSKFQPLPKNHNILPRVHKYLSKDLKKEQRQKTQIKLSEHELWISQKTNRQTQSINSHRQTKYINFVPLKTRYRNQIVDNKKNEIFSLGSIQMQKWSKQNRNLVGFVNMNHIDQNQQAKNQQMKHMSKYLPKQIQYSKKRSLSQLIKQIGKSKDFKLQNSCKYSPWLKTSQIIGSISIQDKISKRQRIQKTDKSIFNPSSDLQFLYKGKLVQNIPLVQFNTKSFFKSQSKER